MMNRNTSLNEIYDFIDSLIENNKDESIDIINDIFWDNFTLSGMNKTQAYAFCDFISLYIERCFDKKNLKKNLAVSK